ncbi:MAG: sodium-dependent transporter [Coprococcus sp.]|nr:sodium-dependent transporter [Coprococcus sp.]
MSNNGQAQFKSRFGYIMVAAGAAIGLGNIWKFPYLAYRGGGGIFLITYIIIIILMAHPMVEMETAIGRHTKLDTVSVYEKINKKWGFVGWIANICTLGINMFYVVVGGWVMKYAVQFIISGDFGEDTNVFFNGFISKPVEPIIWAFIVMAITSFLLLFGITEIVERVTKVIMPALFVILIFCAVYACATLPGAVEGLKYYLIPDFGNFSFKVFADAATQVLFSVGIGWGIFTTLGASLPDSNNLKGDAIMVSIMDTLAAVLAGFVVIPTAFGAGMDVSKGPALLFDVMAGIYGSLPGGRLIGSFFFVGVMFAVFSSLFTFFEISMKTFEIKLNMGRKKGVLVVSVIIFIGNILVSLWWGPLSGIKLPWPNVQGIEFYNLHDWLDCFTGYLLLPLGCLLTCIFVAKIWGWDGYEKELFQNGRDGKLHGFDKALTIAVIPIFMVIVLLNVFGFLG